MYKLLIFTILILFIISCSDNSNSPDDSSVSGRGVDTVYSFLPGTGQNSGQDSIYYPKNIFGLPDTSAREKVQSSNPAQILSLGMGGEIIVGFKGMVVFDSNGVDFTIFENAFLNLITDKIFAEPAKIAVSQDGINYVEFPFDSLTLEGCAGVTPTNGDKNPLNPDKSGGDGFDIKTLGLDWISRIKITDISNIILNNPNHPYYDAIIGGFDLDAVIGLHLRKNL